MNQKHCVYRTAVEEHARIVRICFHCETLIIQPCLRNARKNVNSAHCISGSLDKSAEIIFIEYIALHRKYFSLEPARFRIIFQFIQLFQSPGRGYYIRTFLGKTKCRSIADSGTCTCDNSSFSFENTHDQNGMAWILHYLYLSIYNQNSKPQPSEK